MSTTIAAPPSAEPAASGTGMPSFRTLPHNIAAEKALLGAIFVNNRAYEKISEFLRPEHFALREHGRIFEAGARLIERGRSADPVTLKGFFEQDESLADIGGSAYLAELAASAVSTINAGEYGRFIYDLHLKRELIAFGEDVINQAYGGEVDETAVEQIEQAEQNLYSIATKGEYEGGFEPFKDSLLKALGMAEVAHNRQGGLAGVTTGLVGLDKLLGGLHPSDLVILAGRPAMGKTALATNIAYNAAYSYKQSGGKEGAVVGFFSLEMSAEQLAARIISEQTDISSDRMRKGELSNAEFDRLVPAVQALNEIPIFIDDSPALSVGALRSRARRLRQHELGLIVVDYLQLITATQTSRNDGRVQEVSEITRGLKTLAKELSTPVLALSQLSRQVEQRDPPRPQLSDLRESGSIEQDADVVMFIFREEYYLERKKPVRYVNEDEAKFVERESKWQQSKMDVAGLADVIVAKQRHGPVGDIKLQFQGEFTRFGNLDSHHGK
ncbi:MAG: replicative DNA helicase [Rhodospirillales bacterium]|jgi:replicative DNA helicase|nr:replicative DNA helicase [Rhodospirillales bacterium]HIJ42562.1 replicative DNA helicase [Rhodospirillaceae bacterium]MDP7097225.1 replicative DNA helicase [Rhodospirillales bacterium]MDP7214384.1 replicative DNA helicase [Rhodospirillales bacterium]HIJ92507.1 replicative DNA helicase [Rhodospirillaceae bacterium]